MIINATEDASGVTFSASGTLDVTGFGTPALDFNGDGISPSFGALNFNGAAFNHSYAVIASGPTSFGTGGPNFSPTTSSGSLFIVLASNSSRRINVPVGFTSGPLSGELFYEEATFDSLGVTEGTYVWELTGGQTVTLNAGATPIPLESDALPVVGSALFMVGGLWWRRKRNQAKVAEFIAKH